MDEKPLPAALIRCKQPFLRRDFWDSSRWGKFSRQIFSNRHWLFRVYFVSGKTLSLREHMAPERLCSGYRQAYASLLAKTSSEREFRAHTRWRLWTLKTI